MEMRELRKTNQQLEKLWDEGKNLIEIQVEYKFYSVGKIMRRIHYSQVFFFCLKSCRGPTSSSSILVFLGQASTNTSLLLPFLGTSPR